MINPLPGPLARALVLNLEPGTHPFHSSSGSKDSFVLARLSYEVAVSHQRATSQGLKVTRRLVDARTGHPVAVPKLGQLLRVELSLYNPTARYQIALVDRLAAGLTPVDTELTTSQQLEHAQQGWAWVHHELRNERVAYFADHLPSGTHRVSYLARATQVGDFTFPAAHAEAMYQPDVFGRTAPSQLRIAR